MWAPLLAVREWVLVTTGHYLKSFNGSQPSASSAAVCRDMLGLTSWFVAFRDPKVRHQDVYIIADCRCIDIYFTIMKNTDHELHEKCVAIRCPAF